VSIFGVLIYHPTTIDAFVSEDALICNYIVDLGDDISWISSMFPMFCVVMGYSFAMISSRGYAKSLCSAYFTFFVINICASRSEISVCVGSTNDI
jgi:hypothetical protein